MLDRAVVIVIEGVDLAGKTTAISYTKTIMEHCGYRALCLKRPGPEAMCALVMAQRESRVDSEEIKRIMRSDASRVIRAIRALPAPSGGGPHVVLLDRHYLSAVVKQGEKLTTMERIFGKPDHWVILDVETGVALARGRDRLRMDQRGLDETEEEHAALRAAYSEAAAPLLARGEATLIDTSLFPEPIHTARKIATIAAAACGDL